MVESNGHQREDVNAAIRRVRRCGIVKRIIPIIRLSEFARKWEGDRVAIKPPNWLIRGYRSVADRLPFIEPKHVLALFIVVVMSAGFLMDQRDAGNKQRLLEQSHQNSVQQHIKTETELQKQLDKSKQELDQRAKTEQEQQKQIDDLKNQLSAKKEAERIAATRVGGAGGGSVAGFYPATDNAAGNGYDYGYCTWYVKNRRPDIPNNWGDAWQWWGSAQAIGWPTGLVPKPGAVGQSSGGWLGHVVYVDSVNPDGSVNISEMNYAGWNVASTRTVPATDFRYIY